jgi:hypothetical protein
VTRYAIGAIRFLRPEVTTRVRKGRFPARALRAISFGKEKSLRILFISVNGENDIAACSGRGRTPSERDGLNQVAGGSVLYNQLKCVLKIVIPTRVLDIEEDHRSESRVWRICPNCEKLPRRQFAGVSRKSGVTGPVSCFRISDLAVIIESRFSNALHRRS